MSDTVGLTGQRANIHYLVRPLRSLEGISFGTREARSAQIHDPERGEDRACWIPESRERAVQSQIQYTCTLQEGINIVRLFTMYSKKHPPVAQASDIPQPAHTLSGPSLQHISEDGF